MILVGSNHWGIATATLTSTLPTGTQVGDLAIFCWHVDQGSASSTPSGFVAYTNWNQNARFYYKWLDTAADISQTNNWVLTGGTYEQYGEIMTFRGVNRTINPTATGNTGSFDSTPDFPSITAQYPYAFHIISLHCYSLKDYTDLTSWPSGYTYIVHHSEGANNGFMAHAYKELTAAGATGTLAGQMNTAFYDYVSYSTILESAPAKSGIFFGTNH